MRDKNQWLKSVQHLEEKCGGDVDKLQAEQKEDWVKLDEFWDMIDEEFDGDLEKYDQAAEKARQEIMEWQGLSDAAGFMPELDAQVKDIIEVRLGYLVNPRLSMPHEPFIRALLYNLKSGQIARDKFRDNADEHIKHIRNADMKKSGWISRPPYTEKDYGRYNTYLVEHKEQVQDRFKALLGYMPSLHYSLDAEIYLREFFSDEPELAARITGVDIRAVTIAKYRETYLLQGSPRADASPLQGSSWDHWEFTLNHHNYLM